HVDLEVEALVDRAVTVVVAPAAALLRDARVEGAGVQRRAIAVPVRQLAWQDFLRPASAAIAGLVVVAVLVDALREELHAPDHRASGLKRQRPPPLDDGRVFSLAGHH